MKTFWIASIGAALLFAQTAAAADEPAGTHTCVPRTHGEDDASWMGRTRQYCEIRWGDLVAQSATGEWTHPHYIDVCLHRCRVGEFQASTQPAGLSVPATETLAAAAGVGLAVGAVVTTHRHVSETPASP